MQTKNINIEQAPLNNLPQKLLLMIQSTREGSEMSTNVPPDLPPRGHTIVFTPVEMPLNNQITEVEGYGPYKPVPPPKPLSTSTPTSNGGGSSSFTPPPYRMPPYPLYNEPTIPGSVVPTSLALEGGNGSARGILQPGLQTHSNKFPIEREVILSNGDKNSKIPILHDYKKRTTAAIAPDAPPKQLAAWTQANNVEPQNYSAIQIHNIQTNGVNVAEHVQQQQYRPISASYHTTGTDGIYTYNEQFLSGGTSTGAVPKTTWHGNGIRPNENHNAQQQSQQSQPIDNTTQRSNNIQTSGGNETKENATIKDSNQKNTKSMTKTYQTIRGMISSRFIKGASVKDDVEKQTEETVGLNNVADELRKSTRSIDMMRDDSHNSEEKQITSILKKSGSEQPQSIYGKPKTDLQTQRTENIVMQHQLNQQQQQMLQSHQQMMQQNQQLLQMQYQQQNQALYQHNQRVVDQRQLPQDHQLYYHNSNYGVTPHRPVTRYGMQQTPEQFVVLRHSQYGEIRVQTDTNNEERHIEPRSPQQLERDNIRQKSFMEARRAASQPHLTEDTSQIEQKPIEKNNTQTLETGRRGSYGNVMETFSARPVNMAIDEKDSDDGGFITRNNVRKLESETYNTQSQNNVPVNQPEQKLVENETKKDIANDIAKQRFDALSGTPRTRLEGEIGKIEGVYNIGQRTDKIELDTTENGEKQIIDVTQRKLHGGSGTSSDYDKTGGQSSSNADSGRGSAAYSSGRRQRPEDTSPESSDTHQLPTNSYNHNTVGNSRDSEWVDIVENELRHILEPKLHGLSLQGNNPQVANSTLSESISSMTPPLPPLSPGEGSTPNITPRNSTRYKHGSSLPYGSKPEYGLDSYNKSGKTSLGPGVGGCNNRWQSGGPKPRTLGKKHENSSHKMKQLYGLDLADIASTTTRSMDLDSILDGHSDSDEDMSTNDARTIRKQLEGLETMYGEVLKLLGVKKYTGRYQPSDPRFHKRRYGSMSSLPSSSVSSRPIRDKRARAHEERKKVKDLKGINKRFQRLESHVVTLARSVAHLSSEMRTQHLMIQEMENIREEIAALRTQTTMVAARAQSTPRGLDLQLNDMPSLANPSRVKKLTKFFGDEPPLLRLFLKSLGYEKYANAFENERIGMVELPYVSEERLQKIGIPLGPRLRILQEAQISVCKDTTLCIV